LAGAAHPPFGLSLYARRPFLAANFHEKAHSVKANVAA
jgi:hypothetical protein